MDSRRLSLADLTTFDSGAFTTGDERRFLCPFEACEGYPQDDDHRSLSANENTGLWQCFRCKAGGLLVEYRGRSGGPGRGKVALSQFLGEQKLSDEDTAELQHRLGGAVPLKGTPGEKYVINERGIPLELAHESGFLYHRSWFGSPAVLVPIQDRQGHLVAVSGRSIGEEKKIRVTGHKGLGVFITPGALTSTPIVVTEAAFDSLTLHLCGLRSLALMGTTWPSWLPSRLAFKDVLVALDNDKEGHRASDELMRLLRSLGARVGRFVPENKDWNEDLVIEEHGEEMLRSRLAALGLGQVA